MKYVKINGKVIRDYRNYEADFYISMGCGIEVTEKEYKEYEELKRSEKV